MNHKLRIFYSSNAIWSNSGYGTNSMMLVPQIKDEGYDIAMLNFYGQEGGSFHINDIKMYARMADVWGGDALIHHAKDFNADCVITNQDVWVLDPNHLKLVKRWIPYVPIDHDPAPYPVIERLRLAYRIVAYSKFAKDQMEKQGLYSTYIPLTVETEIFKPMDKKQSRKELGIPDDIFLFGMVSANKDNPPRKSFQEAIDAFKLFHDKHPKSGMYFHTLLQQQGGFPIKSYVDYLGLGGVVYFLEPYNIMYKVGRPELAKIYNAFDVLLAPSTNEGFGVPIIEAQSCGVPVVTNNFTSMPELIIPNKTGLLCDVLYKRYSPMGSYIGVPDHHSIYKCMEGLFCKDRKTMGETARQWVLDHYDYKLVFQKYWKPFLSTIESEVYPS